MVFHFVSLTEAVVHTGQITLASVHNAESVLAFLIMVVFMLVYLVYKTTSPGIVVFPLVFLLTFVAATGQQPLLFIARRGAARAGWLLTSADLTGYAALVLSFGASLLYLLQERALKSKKSSGMFSRLPALQVIDDIGYRSLLLGFPFMTLGLIAGTVVARSYLWPRGFSRSEDSAFGSDVGGVSAHGLHALECGMARTPRRLSRQPGPSLPPSLPGWPTISAPFTGLSRHEIPAHRRQSQDARRSKCASGWRSPNRACRRLCKRLIAASRR